MHWQPTASHDNLKARAQILREIRQFFEEREVLEIETPLLSQHTVTDAHIESFETAYVTPSNRTAYFLQTSPEYAMKRLLAADSGPIYQICKAFRNGECGRKHNPEFTMLEWYRPGFTHIELMQEVDLFLQTILHTPPAEIISYREVFQRYLSVDPLTADVETLSAILDPRVKPEEEGRINNGCGAAHQLSCESTGGSSNYNKDTLLQLLMSEHIEPIFAQKRPMIVYDFPATQAALARIRHDNPPVAERFEAYYKDVELANGFHELKDAQEQKARFEKDQAERKGEGKRIPNMDQRFIAALSEGFPDCAGVAIGIDRLVMLRLGAKHIQEVISFPWDRA